MRQKILITHGTFRLVPLNIVLPENPLEKRNEAESNPKRISLSFESIENSSKPIKTPKQEIGLIHGVNY